MNTQEPQAQTTKSNVTFEFAESSRFPQSLFKWNHYDGARLFAVFLLALSLGYFIYWFVAPRGWVEMLIDKMPFIGSAFNAAGFFWHLFLVASCYCFTWLTFERRSLSGYATGAFAICFGIIYILCPVDFIPDMVPGVGMLDDASVGGSSILFGVKSWMQAQQQRRIQQLVAATLRRGDRDTALRLLLDDIGFQDVGQ